jgi:quercetin dioxygenase-like cupin family protein
MTVATLTRVRPSELPWEPLGTHGLRRKVLGRIPNTGYITSVVDIPRGWHGGGIAHYHQAFEEVYMWSGSVTLDGKHYWHAGDYFYRPAWVVHGHDERSEEGACAIIRSDGPLELNLIHEPAQPVEYPLQTLTDPRGHVFQVKVAEAAAQPSAEFPAEWRIKPLSTDAISGARTFAVEIPAGWRRGDKPLPGRDTRWEAWILEGSLTGQGIEFAAADYTCGPAGMEAFDAESSATGCTFLLWQLPRDIP